jgi:hypothetical protein
MEAAMTWEAATEAEKVDEPLSPELVLVSPDLRERALAELTLPHERNGARQPALRLLQLARDEPEERDDVEVSLLRTARDAVLHVGALAVLLVLVIAGAAFGLTIAPGETEPRFAPPPVTPQPTSPAIATAAVSPRLSVAARPGGTVDSWRRNPPVRLTTYGQLVWNLDALVHDVFGNRRVCLLQAGELSPAACSASGLRQSAYRTTFDPAEGSTLRLRKAATAPALRGGAVPLRLGTKYVSCGRHHWVAMGADRAFACRRER